jgi:hypothetical protein
MGSIELDTIGWIGLDMIELEKIILDIIGLDKF